MSRVDLTKFKQNLVDAHKDVSNTKGKNDWAVFGYDGNSDVLKVVETGDGGIEEMADELNSGKIMYAYCRVIDPNSQLPKFVLINWQGEGAPDSKKFRCANHIKDITDFLKGVHVTVNARCDEDVDEEAIKLKVAKSSGANFNFHKNNFTDVPEAAPVASVYRKTHADAEIRSKQDARDKFWQHQRSEEQNRQEDDRNKIIAEKQQLEDERKAREAEETRTREAKEASRMKDIYAQKAAEKKASERGDVEKQKADWEQQQREALRESEERGKRADQLRRQRTEEAKNLVSQRSMDAKKAFDEKPRSMFDSPEEEEKSVAPPVRKLQSGFLSNPPAEEAPVRRGPIEIPRGDERPPSPPPSAQQAAPPRPAPSRLNKDKLAAFNAPIEAEQPRRPPQPIKLPEAESRAVEEPPVRTQPEPIRAAPVAQQTVKQPEPVAEPEPVPVAPAAVNGAQPQPRNLMQANLPPRQNSDEENEYDDWEDESSANQKAAEPVAVAPQQAAVTPGGDAPQSAGEKDLGMCARALYDYQAGDEDEITFDPGDVITHIEQVDAGWWTGKDPSGKVGMFPANYVELIQ